MANMFRLLCLQTLNHKYNTAKINIGRNLNDKR
eukprot:UN26938